MKTLAIATILFAVQLILILLGCLYLSGKSLFDFISKESLLKMGKAYTGETDGQTSYVDSSNPLWKQCLSMWWHNVRVELFLLIPPTLLWGKLYILSFILGVLFLLLNTVIGIVTWKASREVGLTTREYLDGIWRHGFLEYWSMCLLLTLVFLNEWNTTLVVIGVIGTLVAALIELTLSNAKISEISSSNTEAPQT